MDTVCWEGWERRHRLSMRSPLTPQLGHYHLAPGSLSVLVSHPPVVGALYSLTRVEVWVPTQPLRAWVGMGRSTSCGVRLVQNDCGPQVLCLAGLPAACPLPETGAPGGLCAMRLLPCWLL